MIRQDEADKPNDEAIFFGHEDLAIFEDEACKVSGVFWPVFNDSLIRPVFERLAAKFGDPVKVTGQCCANRHNWQRRGQ